MTGLWLKPEQARSIINHAQKSIPNEACGILVDNGAEIVEVIPLDNVATDPVHEFVFDPAQQATVFSRLHKHRLQIGAIYHSHPTAPPIPSQTDIRYANYPDTPYLIISLRHPSPEFAVWRIRGLEVERLPLTIDTMPPPIELEQTLTPFHRTMLILTGLLSIIMVVVIAIYLLPPAPSIPSR